MKFTKEELVDLVRISKTDIFNELTNDELVDGWLSDKEIKDSERQTDHESQDTGEPSNEILADVNNRYFKCRKCGHKVATLNPFALAVCVQPMSYRTGGICGGEYLEITKGEFNGC